MAYSLLPHGRVWFAFDGQDPEGAGTELVLARLQAVLRFIDELLRRLGEAGVGSLGDVIGLYRRLETILDAIPAEEIARAVEDTNVVARRFADLEGALGELQRLKALLRA